MLSLWELDNSGVNGLRAIEPVSNSLDFQTIVSNNRTFYAAQRFNQFNFGHYKKWAKDVDKC